ncbi:probable nitrilase [Phialocephala subalpina]|uniref:nitrilase n=1 Tax=Phialocephala subalpina TaxID=576137 RepID=A0A1L7XA28_9HELO|nr:probable nitrilase [Phialocephala subalpina]
MSQTIRLGAVQARPIWFDLQGTVQKTIDLIHEAGQKGINVLGFPEVWIPGYPWDIWIQSVPQNTQMVHRYMANSLSINSPEMEAIKTAVKEAGIFVVLGHSERDGGSLYMAQSSISPEGVIVAHRRKIKPTHIERMIWGEGQASSLKSVVDTPFGKIGALCCFEHYQPLLKYYQYSQGEQIHVASWPAFFEVPKGSDWPFHGSPTVSLLASRFMALEGQTFVIVSTQVVKEENLDKMHLLESGVTDKAAGGFAMIYGPDGKELVEALAPDEEGILQADVVLSDIDYSKALLDPVGQYSRPDLLSLLVTKTEGKHVIEK